MNECVWKNTGCNNFCFDLCNLFIKVLIFNKLSSIINIIYYAFIMRSNWALSSGHNWNKLTSQTNEKHEVSPRRIHQFMYAFIYKKKQSYPCNRPWRPIGMWYIEAPTSSRKSAHRWRWGCQPYAPAGRHLPLGRFLVLISVSGWVDPRAIVRLEGLGQLKNPVTSSGIDPVTFHLVAWCLN
jgi:hypothetical protein